MSTREDFRPPDWAGTLAERGSRCIMDTYARYPVELAGGEGCVLVDSRGRELLDFAAGIAVSVLGHGHPAIVSALREASEGLIHVSNLYWTEPAVRLAERLTAACGLERAFFCNSGAEAVEAGLKVARRARPGRPRFVVFEGSFHGRTLGALSATAQPKYQDPFRPLVEGFTVVPFGDVAAVRDAVDDRTAAVLIEPVQGEGGVRPQPPGFLRELRELCDARGALLFLDEVQCGMGRTGALFAFQREGVSPDGLATAKALAGGLPMGAFLARGDAAVALRRGEHGSTYGGGPLVSRVALAVLDVVTAPGFVDDVNRKGERLGRGLDELVRRHELAVEARGRGLMRGLVLGGPHAGKLVADLLQRGLLAVPAGASVIRLVPPLIVTDEQVDRAVDLLDQALADARELASAGGE